jgi:hypothetical protein
MIKNAGNPVKIMIRSVLNIILKYGIFLNTFNTCLIKPIVKEQSIKSFDVKNLRPISISNCISQLFEKFILRECSKIEKVEHNQFGFRKDFSTLHPLFLVKEYVLWCKNNSTPCYIASLYAAKAYDSVWRTGLFFKLTDKISKGLWLLLKNYYSTSKGCLNLDSGSDKSKLFPIDRGVKQGGILTPSLFKAFVNNLSKDILSMNIGLHINSDNLKIR